MADALPTTRRLAVSIAAVVGGLLGVQASPALWALLEALGVAAAPTCRDVVLLDATASAACVRPVGLVLAAAMAAATGAALLGVVAWRVLQPGDLTSVGRERDLG